MHDKEHNDHKLSFLAKGNLKEEAKKYFKELEHVNSKEAELCEQLDSNLEKLMSYLHELGDSFSKETEKRKKEIHMKFKDQKVPDDFNINNLEQLAELYKRNNNPGTERQNIQSLKYTLNNDYKNLFPSYDKLVQLSNSLLCFNTNHQSAPNFSFENNNQTLIHKTDGSHSISLEKPLPTGTETTIKLKINNPNAIKVGVAPASIASQPDCYQQVGVCMLVNNGDIWKDGTNSSTGQAALGDDSVISITVNLTKYTIKFSANNVDYYNGELSNKSEDYYVVVHMQNTNEKAAFVL